MMTPECAGNARCCGRGPRLSGQWPRSRRSTSSQSVGIGSAHDVASRVPKPQDPREPRRAPEPRATAASHARLRACSGRLSSGSARKPQPCRHAIRSAWRMWLYWHGSPYRLPSTIPVEAHKHRVALAVAVQRRVHSHSSPSPAPCHASSGSGLWGLSALCSGHRTGPPGTPVPTLVPASDFSSELFGTSRPWQMSALSQCTSPLHTCSRRHGSHVPPTAAPRLLTPDSAPRALCAGRRLVFGLGEPDSLIWELNAGRDLTPWSRGGPSG